jgi:maltose/moltooligosaccharide transporter
MQFTLLRGRQLSKSQLLNLAICAFGIQFAVSLMMANMSSVYKFLGASGLSLSCLWLIAPLSGIIIQPLVGQLSDDTLTRYGKRRPYIFIWGIVAFICFCLLPFATQLWVGVLLFWGVGCSTNGITETLRALTGDIAPNQQKAQAFSWQTIFAGIGASSAAILPWLLDDVLKIPLNFFKHNLIPFSIQIAFMSGGVFILICMLWTVSTIKEKPAMHDKIKQLYHQFYKRNWKESIYRFFREIFISIKKMPPVIRKFIVPQTFTWIGIFGMWLYFSLAIAQQVYGLPPGADVNNAYYAGILHKSAIKSDFYYGINQFVSILYAIVLPWLVNRFSPKLIYAVSLIIGAVGLIMVGFERSEYLLVISSAAVGIMWGGIMILPYAIVSAELPRGKMGIYLGIFNITITAPEVIGGLCLGSIYKYVFKSSAAYSIILSGVLVLIGGLIFIYEVGPQLLSNYYNSKETAMQLPESESTATPQTLTPQT